MVGFKPKLEFATSNASPNPEGRALTEHIKFVGETEHVETVRNVLGRIGLPLQNVKKVIVMKHEKLSPKNISSTNNLHTFADYQHSSGEIRLSDRLMSGSRAELYGILTHEIAHSVAPTNRKSSENTKLFGSTKERRNALAFVRTIQKQLREADEYLSTYHLDVEYKRKKFWGRMKDFLDNTAEEEAWAIMVEMRFSDPDGLAYVQRKMFYHYEDRIWPGRKPKPIMTRDGSSVAEGIDAILITLMTPHVTDLNSLTKHIAQIPKQSVY